VTETGSFNPLEVSLEGTRLVEASAGTGKTYSIAVLYLRLVMEEKLPVESILVVTYTRAATAELKERIRYFLAEAVHAFEDEEGTCREEVVSELVLKYKDAKDAQKRLALLKEAILWLDESAVFTIHGFCQRVLGDSAFETGEPWETEMILDQEELVKEAVRDFWRTHVTDAAPLILNVFADAKISLDKLIDFAQNNQNRHLVEIRYPDSFSPSALEGAYKKMTKLWSGQRGEIETLLLDSPALMRRKKFLKAANLPLLFEAIETCFTGASEIPPGLEVLAADALAEQVKAKHDPVEHPFFDAVEEFFASAADAPYWLMGRLLGYLREELPRIKREQNLQYFDDLLMRLYGVLQSSGGEVLTRRLRGQYRAALIDEFQDTDPVQYYIFNTLFNYKKGSLFLIGDPKQSIYGFRGADIFAYMKACHDVTSRHTLETNWRSETPLVEALNELFDRPEPFLFKEIGYDEVKPGTRADREPLTINGSKEKPMVLWDLGDDEEYSGSRIVETAVRAVTSEVVELLSGKARLGDRPLVPGDIAILVQEWHQGRSMKEALTAAGVPAIMTAVASVFKAEEARELYRCLSAIAEPGREGTLRGAMATSLLGVTHEGIYAFNNDEAIREEWQSSFRELHRLWEQKGFMIMFTRFMEHYRIAPRVVAGPEGERRLTNILHIMELLHRRSAERGSAMHHLLGWYAERLGEERGRSEEYEQRLESDADALSIITVHRSKGLQYPVVFCPFLHRDAKAGGNDSFIYHDDDHEIIQVGGGSPEGLEAAQNEMMAEQLRLFYVAVTRAQNRCYLLRAMMKNPERRGSHYFLQDAPERFAASQVISIENVPGPAAGSYRNNEENRQAPGCRDFSSTITKTWKVTSFSSLTAESHNRESEAKDHDRAFFPEPEEQPELLGVHSFPKGPRAGTALHQVFEEIDFTETDHRTKIQEILRSWSLEGEDDRHVSIIEEMTAAVLGAQLPGVESFALKDISLEDRLTEMEFFFSLAHISGDEFDFIDDNLTVHETEGYIRGFIDSVVRYGGRYYIIDWKSNFLGSDTSAYHDEALAAAMTGHRYTLQYLLYTVALHRFLGERLPGYDYEKHFGGAFYVFLRGVKEGTSQGIFSHRPTAEEVKRLEGLLCGEGDSNRG